VKEDYQQKNQAIPVASSRQKIFSQNK